MEDRDKDLQAFHADMDKRRREIEAEIEKQRQAVEAESVAKRRAMEEQLAAQRNELGSQQREQTQNLMPGTETGLNGEKQEAESMITAESGQKTEVAPTAQAEVGKGGDLQEEPPPKWYVTLFKVIGFLLAVLLTILVFYFGTILTYRFMHQSEPTAVVYPRTAMLETDAEGNVIHAGEKIVPVLDERINVLVMGTDYGDSEAEANEPKRTDAMLLISFGPEDKKVAVLSLPRDTKVILPGHRDAQKLNAAYAFGGVMMAKQTVANLLGVPITHYAIADWQAFIKVVDLIGGVDLLVEHDMKYDDPYANLHIDLKQGYQHLNGAQAGQYVRFRSDELGDIGRAQRQQKFLRAALTQMFTVGNVVKIPSLINLISECVQTDMSTMTMLKALNSIKLFGDEKIKTGTLSGTFEEENDISYWVTDDEIIKRVLTELEIPSSKVEK